MKIAFLAFLITSSLFVRAQNSNADCKPDTSRIAIFPFSTYFIKAFDSTFRSSILNKDEFCLFQKIVVDFFNSDNTGEFNYRYADYKYQCMPVTDSKGKKLVLVNGFCKHHRMFNLEDWKIILVRPRDGGSCFFAGIIDLSKNKMEYIKFNGEA